MHPVGSPYSKDLSFIVIHFPLDSISVRVLQVRLEILDDLYLSRSIDERDHHAEALAHVVKYSCSENELLSFGSHGPRRDERSQCSLRETNPRSPRTWFELLCLKYRTSRTVQVSGISSQHIKGCMPSV